MMTDFKADIYPLMFIAHPSSTVQRKSLMVKAKLNFFLKLKFWRLSAKFKEQILSGKNHLIIYKP